MPPWPTEVPTRTVLSCRRPFPSDLCSSSPPPSIPPPHRRAPPFALRRLSFPPSAPRAARLLRGRRAGSSPILRSPHSTTDAIDRCSSLFCNFTSGGRRAAAAVPLSRFRIHRSFQKAAPHFPSMPAPLRTIILATLRGWGSWRRVKGGGRGRPPRHSWSGQHFPCVMRITHVHRRRCLPLHAHPMLCAVGSVLMFGASMRQPVTWNTIALSVLALPGRPLRQQAARAFHITPNPHPAASQASHAHHARPRTSEGGA